MIFAALAAALGGCVDGSLAVRSSYSGQAQGFNVLIVLADALRADHLGVYGYPRDTSPNLDRWATEGVVFEQAISPSTFTAQVLTSVFTGRLPSMNPHVGWLSQPARDSLSLAEIFQNAGYRTAFISPTPVLAAQGFKSGFEIFGSASDLSAPDLNQQLMEEVKSFLSKNSEKPFFTYLHFFDPHEPYAPDASAYAAMGAVGQQPQPGPIVKEDAVSMLKQGVAAGHHVFEDFVLKYDTEIRAIDERFGELMDFLDSSGLSDNTLVVFVSDHGDEFWEHGYVDHAWTLYQEVLRVPLIISAPGRLQPGRRSERVSTMDLYATLAGVTGLAADESQFTSVNLFGRNYRTDVIRPLISELVLEDRNLVRAVTKGNWKFHSWVKYVPPHQRYPPLVTAWNELLIANGSVFDYWRPVMKEELFNLSWDSAEQFNVIGRFPDVADELRSVLTNYQQRTAEEAHDEEATPEAQEQLERLRSLGYLQSTGGDGGVAEMEGSRFEIPLYKPGTMLSLGVEGSDPYLPYGWSTPEGDWRWTFGNESMLWFRLESPRRMTLEVTGETYADQAVGLFINGLRVGTLWPDRLVHRFNLAPHVLQRVNRVLFLAPKSTSPRRVSGQPDDRDLGFSLGSIRLLDPKGS